MSHEIPLGRIMRNIPPGITPVEDTHDMLSQTRRIAGKFSAAGAGTNEFKVTVPENELWDILFAEMLDGTSAGTLQQIFVKVHDLLSGTAAKVSGGTFTEDDNSGGVLVKNVAAVAANASTTWEPMKEWVLHPGDYVRFVFGSATASDVLHGRLVIRRRELPA